MRIDLAFAVAALLGSHAAWAQLEADTDGDGAISLTEYQAGFQEAAEQRFQSRDTDGDGLLTAEELRGGRDRGELSDNVRTRFSDRVLTRLDSDDDGFVTLAEVQAGRPDATSEWFTQRDANGDGQLSGDELRTPRFGGRDRDGVQLQIDSNGDGAWSLDELQAVREDFSAERFEQLDSDGDGIISEDERSGRRGVFRDRRRR